MSNLETNYNQHDSDDSEEENQRGSGTLTMRQHIVREIIQTENTYVRDIDLLIKMYKKPMEQKGLIPTFLISKIFSDIEIIFSINNKISASLQESGNQESHRQSISMVPVGEIYSGLAPFLKMYKNYCHNHHNAVEILTQNERKSKKLAIFLKETAESQECGGLTLKDYLIKPIQRLCKYPLLFGNLLQQTPKESADYNKIEETIKKINLIVQDINDSSALTQNFQDLLAIEARINDYPGHLATPDRKFMKEVRVFKCSGKFADMNTFRKGLGQERVVMIFQDKFIYCKKGKGLSQVILKEQLIFKGEMLFSALSISETPKTHIEHDISFYFTNLDSDKVYMFFTDTTTERNECFQLFKQLSDEAKSKIDGSSEFGFLKTQGTSQKAKQILEKGKKTFDKAFSAKQGGAGGISSSSGVAAAAANYNAGGSIRAAAKKARPGIDTTRTSSSASQATTDEDEEMSFAVSLDGEITGPSGVGGRWSQEALKSNAANNSSDKHAPRSSRQAFIAEQTRGKRNGNGAHSAAGHSSGNQMVSVTIPPSVQQVSREELEVWVVRLMRENYVLKGKLNKMSGYIETIQKDREPEDSLSSPNLQSNFTRKKVGVGLRSLTTNPSTTSSSTSPISITTNGSNNNHNHNNNLLTSPEPLVSPSSTERKNFIQNRVSPINLGAVTGATSTPSKLAPGTSNSANASTATTPRTSQQGLKSSTPPLSTTPRSSQQPPQQQVTTPRRAFVNS